MKYVIPMLTMFMIACGGADKEVLNPPADEFNVTKEAVSIVNMPTELDVFTATKDKVYRIPSMVQLLDGSYVVFAEERDGVSDYSRTQIVFQKVTADGFLDGPIRTFSSTTSRIRNNPQAVVLSNGDILVGYSNRKANTASLELCKGTADPGMNFMRASQSDLNFEKYAFNWTAPSNKTQIISPSNGIEKDGKIYVSTYFLGSESNCNSRNHLNDFSAVMVSQDGGASFNTQTVNIEGTNETSLGFIGDVLLQHSRDYSEFVSSASHRSLTETLLTSNHSIVTYLNYTSPVVHGGMAVVNNTIYLSFPHSDERENLIILNRSTQALVQLTNTPTAYSNMLAVTGGMAIVYENGVTTPYEKITMKWVSEF